MFASRTQEGTTELKSCVCSTLLPGDGNLSSLHFLIAVRAMSRRRLNKKLRKEDLLSIP